MSNLRTAILAIEAEINHAKKGLAYYAERVDSLEQALTRIVTTEGTPAGSNGSLKAGAKVKGKAKRAKRFAAEATTSGESAELPSTGGDYWQNLVTDQPKSGQEILAEAVRGLGFAPSKVQVGKLMNRMTFALNTLVKSGKIQDSGAGRGRRFFKK